MSTVKLSLAGMSVPEKIQFARQVGLGIANQFIPLPDPPYDNHAVKQFATALETAYNAAQTARQIALQRTTAQNVAEAALVAMLNAEANYVQSASGGDAALIESVGMSVKSAGNPIGKLPAPSNLSVTEPETAGQVGLRWTGLKGAKSYHVESATDVSGNGNWQLALSSTKGKGTVKGLTGGTKYWFRVAAIGAAGQGDWSGAVVKIAG